MSFARISRGLRVIGSTRYSSRLFPAVLSSFLCCTPVAMAAPGDITTYAGGMNGTVAGTSIGVNYVTGISANAAGDLYVASPFLYRLLKMTPSGDTTSFAGKGPSLLGRLGDGNTAGYALLNLPMAAVEDSAGNVYIADYLQHRIRKVDTAGIITTVAGTGVQGFSGDGGSAIAATLNYPGGVAVDGAGNLYVADTENSRIRKVDTSGVITTIAGNGGAIYLGDGGPATQASLNKPFWVKVTGSGDLLIADTANHRVRRVNASGIITTIAGTGVGIYSGDGVPAVAASLFIPTGIDTDAAGNIYIADKGNHRIRKIDALGFISTVAGNGTRAFSGDGGPAIAATLNYPGGVAVDASGRLFITDSDNRRIRRVDTTGVITTIAGGGSGDDGIEATKSLFQAVDSVAVDAAGNVYIHDGSNRIRKVSPAGIITTFAGNGTGGYSGDGGPATSARLSPTGVTVDQTGNVYIAASDIINSCIRKVDAATGIITTVAGNGTVGYSGDGGPATAAQLAGPRGVAVDGAGNLYIADSGNQRIRKVSTSGIITTIAGTGVPGYSGDGVSAISAQLNNPRGVAVDGSGNVYIADFANRRIRKVNAFGTITTVAGNGTKGYGGDGGPATSVGISRASGVHVDSNGNLFFADTFNGQIRKVNAAGTITTVAGDGEWDYWGDGGPATGASLNLPRSVWVDSHFNVFIADTDNGRVRRIEGPN